MPGTITPRRPLDEAVVVTSVNFLLCGETGDAISVGILVCELRAAPRRFEWTVVVPL